MDSLTPARRPTIVLARFLNQLTTEPVTIWTGLSAVYFKKYSELQ
jgi:hypothetical protein